MTDAQLLQAKIDKLNAQIDLNNKSNIVVNGGLQQQNAVLQAQLDALNTQI